MKKDYCTATQCTLKLADKIFDSAKPGYRMESQPDDEIAIQTSTHDHNL